MKTRIKKDVKTWQYVTIFFSAILLLGISFWWADFLSQLCLLWIVCTILVCSDYFIVNKTYIKQIFRKVDIRQIHDVIQTADGVDVCYQTGKNKREGVLHLRPRNKEDLIAKLLEINPDIQIK